MRCHWTMDRIDRYVRLDLGPVEEALVRLHLRACPRCSALYERTETVAPLLGTLRPPRPSAQLGTRILSALSMEVARRNQPALARRRLTTRFGNLLRPVAVPALGGSLLALILLPALLSVVWIGPTAQADDIPLRFLATPFVAAPTLVLPSPLRVSTDFAVVAHIDMAGNVYDYRIASDEPMDSRMRGEIANALLTSRFEPARHFGQPTLGHRVILYQRIDARG